MNAVAYGRTGGIEGRSFASFAFARELLKAAGMESTGPEASQLIRAIATSKDRAAFTVLFRHYAPRVKAYLSRHGATPGVAEDLAQETLLTVWRKAAQFDPARAHASAWIFAIARNLRIDQMRKERYPEPDLIQESPAPPETLAAAAETEGRVRQALKDLSSDQIEVVRLSFFEDRTHSEIESLLSIPLGTVKSRLRLAMARLRSALKDDEGSI